MIQQGTKFRLRPDRKAMFINLHPDNAENYQLMGDGILTVKDLRPEKSVIDSVYQEDGSVVVGIAHGCDALLTFYEFASFFEEVVATDPESA